MTSIENLAKEWAVNSNEVLRVSLYSDADDKEPVTFGPVFTYPIYGDAETIYGFKDLTINVS
jgi:histone acetyltransferase 1